MEQIQGSQTFRHSSSKPFVSFKKNKKQLQLISLKGFSIVEQLLVSILVAFVSTIIINFYHNQQQSFEGRLILNKLESIIRLGVNTARADQTLLILCPISKQAEICGQNWSDGIALKTLNPISQVLKTIATVGPCKYGYLRANFGIHADNKLYLYPDDGLRIKGHINYINRKTHKNLRFVINNNQFRQAN